MNKLFLSFILCLLNFSYANELWLQNYSQAQLKAKQQKKYLLLNFSGSDWCHWCQKLEQEVFSQKEFLDYAKNQFVLVNLDFPENKSLSESQKKHNEKLQKEFQIRGFPSIVLLDSQSKKIAQTGYRKGGAKAYVEHLKSLLRTTEKHKESAQILKVGKNGNYQDIQQAIDEARPGDRIEMQTGVYKLPDSLLLERKNNITIEGKGKVQLICLETYANVFTIIDSHYVTIKNIIGTHSEPAKGERCTGNVFFVSGGSHNVISNCDINGCGAIGVYAFTKNLIVDSNHIHNNSLWPMTLSGHDFVVSNNLIENNGDDNHIHYRYSLDPDIWIPNQFFNSDQKSEIQGLRMEGNTFRK